MSMEFATRTQDLAKELALVQGVVERKTTIPILSNVLIEAREVKNGGEIEIRATDLEVGVRTICDATVKKAGKMTLPARRLNDIVSLLPDSELQITARDGSWASLTCDRTRYRLAGAGAEDFPPLPDYDFKDGFAIEMAPFKAMIERVVFAISNEDPRFSIKGALLIVEGATLSLVATDGHRLSMVTRENWIRGAKPVRVLVPRKALVELLKFDAGTEGELRFGSSGNHLFFKMGRRLIQTTTLDTDFPKYERVIPDKNDRLISLETQALRTALGRVTILAADRTRLVRVAVAPGRLTLSSESPTMGEAEETLPVEYDGPEFQIGFNSRFLLDFLQATAAPRVRMELRDEQTQGMFRPEGEGEWEHRYVVMPVRLT